MNVLLEFMHYEFGSEVCQWSYKVEFGHGWGEGGGEVFVASFPGLSKLQKWSCKNWTLEGSLVPHAPLVGMRTWKGWELG